MEIFESKVTDKFQVTLPKGCRDAIGARVGDTVAFLVEGKVAQVALKPGDVLARMRELSGGRRSPGIAAEVRKARAGW
ncbi:MAG: AbrB/MazE/SpoVT family DNA-binding domain-containing protein [Candidatus Micrarchaeota archaeon]